MGNNVYLPIIGLEIHVELGTKSKMFCGCDARHFRVEPNTHTCPVCLGLPGALPVPNKKAIEWTMMLGLALGCKINKSSKFDRKNYFYPDLPKGYQISQYDEPIAEGGWLELKTQNSKLKTTVKNLKVDNPNKKIRITRVHLEEDTGKLVHRTINGPPFARAMGGKKKVSLVDFNRSGVPLLEMVTEPDLRSAAEAKEFAKWFQRTVRYLGISECDMEKGSMRLEANISLLPRARIQDSEFRIQEKELPKYKVEVKNINSFRFLGRAIEYEIERQRKLLEQGKTPKQETRGFDESQGVTFSQRSKEEAADYRYFPEPDIPPLEFTGEMIARIKKEISELPLEALDRLMKVGVREDFAEVLVASKESLVGFDKLVKKLPKDLEVGEVIKQVVNQKWDLAKLSVDEVVKKLKAGQRSFSVSGGELEELVEQVIRENPGPVEQYKKGKVGILGFLVGQVVKKSHGEADPREVREVLGSKL